MVTMLVLQSNTKATGSFGNPTPLAMSLNLPETLNDVPGDGFGVDVNAVMFVETGFDSVPVWRFSVIVPGPVIDTGITLLVPEHDKPPVQLQLAMENPVGT